MHMEQQYMMNNMYANVPSSSLSVFAGPRMNPVLWSRLPNFLLDRVIAFLPPPAFFRFRSVCKRWNALLFSNHFHRRHLSVSPSRHWFLFFKRKTQNGYIYTTNNGGSHGNEICEGYLYDPCEMRWYRLRFPSWMSGFTPAASSGGLLTWISDQGGYKQLVVSNPFLKDLALPPATQAQRLCPSVGLATSDSVFWVMLAGDDLVSQYNVKNISAECLTASRGDVGEILFSVWEHKTRSQLPDLMDLSSEKMVFVEGKFYCMSYSPHKVLAYDIQTKAWTAMDPPMMRYIRSPCLVECRGRLFIIAAVAKSPGTEPKTVRLWEFNPNLSQRHMWGQGMKMPRQVHNEFECVENGECFDCVGHGDFIVFTFNTSDRILLLNLSHNSWQWIPVCPYLYPYGSERLRAFAYEPRLRTPAMDLLEPFSQVVHVPHPMPNQLGQ